MDYLSQIASRTASDFRITKSAILLCVACVIADIAERALQAIGAQPDWTYEEFEDASEDPNESIRAELDACDEAYFKTEDGIANTLFEYIKKNKSDINLGPKSA